MSCCIIDSSDVGSGLEAFLAFGAGAGAGVSGAVAMDGSEFNKKLASLASISSSVARGEVARDKLTAKHMETTATTEMPTKKRTFIAEFERTA